MQSSCKHTLLILQAIHSFWLLFRSSFNKKVPFCLSSTSYSFYDKGLFLCACLCCLFWLEFFFCLGLIWFLLVMVFLCWSCLSFYLYGELEMISDFSPHWFARLINMEVFKIYSKESLLWSNDFFVFCGQLVALMLKEIWFSKVSAVIDIHCSWWKNWNK